MEIIPYLLTTIFIILALFHIYWVIGGTWGFATAAPQHPNGSQILFVGKSHRYVKMMTLIVAIQLFFAAIIILWKMELIPQLFPIWVSNLGVWVLAIIFLLRAVGEFKYVGFFKKIRTTSFARMDTILFSPLCLLISVLSFIFAFVY